MTLLASAGTDFDVVVVGAGVAGLAAAGTLRRAKLRVELLEAGPRIGGRAFTGHPPELGGVPFDHGAQWLHAAHRNPLVPCAQANGEDVHADQPWERRLHVTDQGGPADMQAYTQAETQWQAAVEARLAGPDCSLSQAASCVASEPWTPTIEAWEGAIIAAADATDLSLHDWHANQLDGENFTTAGGLGALLGRLLATPAHLGSVVRAIEADGGGSLRVETQAGVLRTRACIVTVSTGVLRAGQIAFRPHLPASIQNALEGLPMGLLSKVVLRAAGPDRLGLSPGTNVFKRLRHRGVPFLSTLFWGNGTDLAVGFIGGKAAWSLATDSRAAGDFMRSEIAGSLGSQAAAAFTPAVFTTDWGTNALFRGAYAYAMPGCAEARRTLAEPAWEERLWFAGEACAPDGLAGTVAGAYVSGRNAASSLIASLS